jgi:signal transduction histidine kinase
VARGSHRMKTILVLAQHPSLVDAISNGLNPEQYRAVHRDTLEQAEPMLVHGLVDACILEVEGADVQSLWVVEKLRRIAPKIPVILYANSRPWEWEEQAYQQGVAHILTKPVRPRILATLLDRQWQSGAIASSTVKPPLPALVARSVENSPVGSAAVPQALSVLRDFSGILTHSLNADALLKQFLLFLREILGVNRAAIFLRQPVASMDYAVPLEGGRRLTLASAVGVSASLLQHFQLSFDAGIGGQVFRLGRILRRNSEEARNDSEAQKEFELLGAQIAVPILDRETVLGVAVFDGRITGEQLSNSELELVFHLLEQLGLAIKNIWLHDQLAGNHEMMAEILRELSSACIVISRDLEILHANKAARKYFARPERRGGDLEFSDLPQVVGTKAYQVLKTGSAVSNFRYEPQEPGSTAYNINVVPFQRQPDGTPASALLVVEDLTQSEQFRKLEVEAANLRLVKTMADRLAHEIGNAMVPLSTHQQLLADKYKDPEFRASLDSALADGVKRVTRLINQMRFLARDTSTSQEAFPMTPLIEEAFQEARKYQPVKTAQLKCESGGKPIVMTGDRAALKHALAEVLLNALQANPSDPRIGVKLEPDANGNGRQKLQIDVQDNGAGFSPEAMQKAAAPFFTTRNVGLGLGLTVSRKIIETHHGKLEIVAPDSEHPSIVRISLPMEKSAVE